MRILSFAILGFLLVAAFVGVSTVTHAETAPPKSNGKFNIVVTGVGAQAYTEVEMISGGKRSDKVKANNVGAFSFPVLAFNPALPLNMGVSVKVMNPQTRVPLVTNILTIAYSPYKGTAEVKGVATPSSMIVGNLTAEDSATAIANDDGRFTLRLSSMRGINDESSKLIVSVVNVQNLCCPKAYLPAAPMTLTVQMVKPDVVTPPSAPAKIGFSQSEYKMTLRTADNHFAVSVPQEKIDDSWFKVTDEWKTKITDQLQQQSLIRSALMNAQENLNTLQSAKAKQAASLINARGSNQVCRMATLSRSLAKADLASAGQQRAISDVFLNRDLGKEGSLHVDSSGVNLTSGMVARLELFKTQYCDKKAENTSLNSFCDVNIDTALNRDIDFTRTVDVPLTVDADFLDSETATGDEPALIAFGENIFPSLPIGHKNNVNETGNKDNYMKSRSLLAARNVARNSYAAVVAEKTKTEGGVAPHAIALLKTMMFDPDEAVKLIGEKPSYFAQMEMLTKTIFQTPAFVKNLMENPANVKRTRVAIRAIDLQQNADLLESMYRREMLLATYLEQKIQEKAVRSGISQ